MVSAERESFWSIHAGHVALLVVWVLVFGAVYLRGRVSTRAIARSGWVWGAASASLASGAVHLSVIREHFGESALYGTFFLVLTVLQAGWAAWLLIRPSRVLLQSGAAASGLVVLLWLATRTIGIPAGPAAGETEPFGSWDILASLFEAVVVVTALRALRPARIVLPAGRRPVASRA